MAVSIIPFKMPEPMEIPEHIVSMLRELPKHDAVAKAMELLIEIDAAHTTIYEAVDDDGNLQLKEVLSTESASASTLKQQLESGEIYGKRLTQMEADSLAAQAFAQESSLLVMGQVDGGTQSALPADLQKHLLAGADSGNVGYIYVLLFSGADDRPLGALTLIRPFVEGPLNHEQPNITERVRQELCSILDS